MKISDRIGGPWISGHVRTNSKNSDLGFPLEKAIQYEKLRKPFVINDLEKQWDIQGLVRSFVPIFRILYERPPSPTIAHRDTIIMIDRDRLLTIGIF